MNLKAALNTKKVLALVLAGVSAAAILGAAATPVHAAPNDPVQGSTEVIYRAGSGAGDEESNWMVTYPLTVTLDDASKDETTGKALDVTLQPRDKTKSMKITQLTVAVGNAAETASQVVTLSGTTSTGKTVTVSAEGKANTAAPQQGTGKSNVFTVPADSKTPITQSAVKVWIPEAQITTAWNAVEYRGTMQLTFTPTPITA